MESGHYMPGRGHHAFPDFYNEKVPYFDDFMDRYAKSHWGEERNRLIRLALFLEHERNTTVIDADFEDIKAFFKKIDARDLARSTKNKWRHVLNSYYEFVKEIKEKMEKTEFINPVPSINLFDFNERKLSLDDLEKEEDLLTYQIAERILNYLYFTKRRVFIAVCLLLYSGARISEVCRVELRHLDFNERFFFTRVKSKKKLKRYGIYFFPKFFVPYLQDWINTLLMEVPDAVYLFEYHRRSLNPKTIREHLRRTKNELGLTCKMNPHAFRDLINTERFDTPLAEKYRFLLLNQTPPNVNVMSYLKKYKKRKELLKKYDQFFPFPEFKPKINLF